MKQKTIHSKIRRLLLVYLFVNSYLTAYNQVIKGTILDKETQDKIIFATVYFDGSFVGTYSDKNGYFELDISKYASRPLTISALGYYSVTLKDFSIEEPLLIYLVPKMFEIKEVVIKAKSQVREREKNLKLFKENFLGTSANARNCRIINENDITLISENDTLKAFASKPIQLDNDGLGYKTTYYLDRFWFDKKRNSFFIIGNLIFNEDLGYNESRKGLYESRRKESYLGSRMHFFRALWKNDLESAGFSLKDLGNKFIDYNFINYNNLINQTDSLTKKLKYNGKLGIVYHLDMTTSWMTFLKDFVSFDKRGYFDPFAISWDGEMARQRIADWLPYEYSIK